MTKFIVDADTVFISHRQSLIHRIAEIVGCLQTAEDLAHDAYLKLVRAKEGQEIMHPSSFLYQIGRNLAIDYRRKQQVRSQVIEEVTDDNIDRLDHIASLLPTPEQYASEQQHAELLLSVLQGLSERRRQIFVLHYFHHWTYDQIAKHSGISRSAVEKNIHVVLSQLMAVKDEYDLF
jgi:RNA polymerase sigma factor (sigma-70 family)